MPLTTDDVPAVVRALLARATVPGPPLCRPAEELRTWFALVVHPDDEPAMSARVAADPYLQALVTVQASEVVDPGMAYLVDQDKLKLPDHVEYRFEPVRVVPSWLRDHLYFTACVPSGRPLSPFVALS